MANRLEGLWQVITDGGVTWELARVSRMSGIGFPPISLEAQRTPTEHGSSHVGFRLGDRTVTVGIDLEPAFILTGDCGEEARRRGPYRAFSPFAGPLRLRRTLRDHSQRELRRCWYVGGLERDSANLFDDVEVAAFQLVCRDPAWYDPDSHSIALAYGDFTHGVYSSTASLDDGDGLETAGDWYAFPTITIEGPCMDFDLRSTTTGQRLRLTYDAVAGETVTLVTNPHGLAATTTEGDDVIIQNYIPPGDDFGGFCLWPDPLIADGANEWELTVQGIDAGSVITFSWEDRYLGI